MLYNLTNLDRDDSEVVKTTQSPARWAARLVLVGSHVTLQGLDPVGLGESFYLDIVDMGDRALRALGRPAQGVYGVVGGNGCAGVVGPRLQFR